MQRRYFSGALNPLAAPGWPKSVSIGLFVILALVALQSARLGAAGVLVHLAESEIERWKGAPRTVAAESADRVASQLGAALRIVPGNPAALEKLGLLNIARMRSHRDPAAAVAATERARALFREALRERPASAYLWADLALAKLYLAQVDEELFAALRHADALGSWEPAVQETLLFVGLALWQDLSPELRDARRRSILRAARRNPQKMFEIAKQFRRLDLVCGLGEYNRLAARDCQGPSVPAPTGPAARKR